MQDDPCLQDGLHTTRAQIAELLDERRVEVANSVVALLKSRDVDGISPLIVRTLVHALAKAMADSSPDVIVHWSRMIRQAHPAPAVIAMIDAACDAAEELAQNDHGDLATIVVFLEIVKGRARVQIADDLSTGENDAAPQNAIQSLLAILRARDDATCNHSRATGDWGRRIATRMGLASPMVERIAKAGVLHDIGKIRVPDAILLKPAALDQHEWEIMKGHAQAGAEILSQIPALAQYAPIVAAHHERFDGRGYPYGLRGDELTLESRVVSVADSFHAMISDRPYRRALSYGEAIVALNDGRGTQWDGSIVEVMVALAAEERNNSVDASLSALTAAPQMGETLPLRLSGDVRA
jgi:putative nucleotidyltransferase with HDIG domain